MRSDPKLGDRVRSVGSGRVRPTDPGVKKSFFSCPPKSDDPAQRSELLTYPDHRSDEWGPPSILCENFIFVGGSLRSIGASPGSENPREFFECTPCYLTWRSHSRSDKNRRKAGASGRCGVVACTYVVSVDQLINGYGAYQTTSGRRCSTDSGFGRDQNPPKWPGGLGQNFATVFPQYIGIP